MTPESLSRIQTDIEWLTQEIGPRPAFSSEARLTALGIRDRLKEAGWTSEFIHTANNLVSCKGTGRVLLLAHSDTVPNSPGTLDNAVAVATLLEIARLNPKSDLCVGFPAQEEIGLVGSRHLAEQIEAWHPEASKLELVVSLDLVGHGTLSVTGLNKDWSHSHLQTLLNSTSIHSEYGYQVVSRLLPAMERSDHAPFADAGYLSMQLLGRDEYGVIPHYHQPTDTTYDIESIAVLVETLDSIIETSWVNQPSSLLPSATIGSVFLPWWMVGVLLMGTLVNSIRSFRQDGFPLLGPIIAILMGLIAGGIASLPSILSLFTPNEMELEVASLLPIHPSGWWDGANVFLPLYVGTLLVIRKLQWCRGNAVATAGLLGLGLSVIDPILSLPWLIGSLLSSIHPMLGLVSVVYWLQPNILRQLSVHGLLPPVLWGVLGILGMTAVLVKSHSND